MEDKMKRIICILLSIIISAAVFAACGQNPKEGHKVLFRDDSKSEEVTATLFDNDGKKTPAEIEQTDKNGESVTYAVYGDTKKYNKIVFTCDGETPTSSRSMTL